MRRLAGLQRLAAEVLAVKLLEQVEGVEENVLARQARARTHKLRLFGNRWLPQATCASCWMLRRSSDAVATSREGHHTPRSNPAVLPRRLGREPRASKG